MQEDAVFPLLQKQWLLQSVLQVLAQRYGGLNEPPNKALQPTSGRAAAFLG